MKTLIRSAAIAAFLGAAPVHALMPESGIYVIDGLGGVGLDIEIQDNLLGMGIYTYDPDSGDPLFYTSTNVIDNEGHYEGTLDYNSGGSSLGGVFMQHDVIIGGGGSVTIDFENEQSGTITFTEPELLAGIAAKGTGPVSYPMQRAFFGFGVDPIRRLLGRWTVTVDYSFWYPEVPYEGDSFIFDTYVETDEGNFVNGCRPSSLVNVACGQLDLFNHGIAGVYDEMTGEFLILVDDSPDTFREYYFPMVGNQVASGENELYLKPDQRNGIIHPAVMARTASGTGINGGDGPASVADVKASESTWSARPAARLPLKGSVATSLTTTEKAERRREMMAKLARFLENQKLQLQ